MKNYQETWVKRLEDGTTESVKSVCQEIVDDDTGITDELCQTLAGLLFKHVLHNTPDEE